MYISISYHIGPSTRKVITPAGSASLIILYSALYDKSNLINYVLTCYILYSSIRTYYNTILCIGYIPTHRQDIVSLILS